MAKAKPKKPAKRTVFAVDAALIDRVAVLERNIEPLYGVVNHPLVQDTALGFALREMNARGIANEEAICPRVAARLTALERDLRGAMESMSNNIGILDREHSQLGKIVNENAAKSDALLARVGRLEKTAGVAKLNDAIDFGPRRPPPSSAPYRSQESYQRLWDDIFKEKPAPQVRHPLDANEAWIVNNIVAIAGSRMTRQARAELIERLLLLNKPEA